MYPEDKRQALYDAIEPLLNNQPELEDYLNEMFYALKDREVISNIVSPDRTYPTTRG